MTKKLLNLVSKETKISEKIEIVNKLAKNEIHNRESLLIRDYDKGIALGHFFEYGHGKYTFMTRDSFLEGNVSTLEEVYVVQEE
ncbi:MAG: hypothetical protein KC516_01390 [Nanoarchaeota archaeon]|nr:hypothetical protein [Nanoarchaeota archaeon]